MKTRWEFFLYFSTLGKMKKKSAHNSALLASVRQTFSLSLFLLLLFLFALSPQPTKPFLLFDGIFHNFFRKIFFFLVWIFSSFFRGCFMKHELKSYPKTYTNVVDWVNEKKETKKKIFIVEIGFCWTLCTKIFFCLPLHPINFLFSPTRCDVFCGGLRFMIFKPLTVHWHMWNAHWTLIFHVSMWE